MDLGKEQGTLYPDTMEGWRHASGQMTGSNRGTTLGLAWYRFSHEIGWNAISHKSGDTCPSPNGVIAKIPSLNNPNVQYPSRYSSCNQPKRSKPVSDVTRVFVTTVDDIERLNICKAITSDNKTTHR